MSTATKELQKHEGEARRSRKVYTPDVDILERNDDILLIADMPGVDENSVEVTLEKNTLRIYGKTGDYEPEDYRLAESEYGTGDYERVFSISDEIDRDGIHATVKNGVLRLVLPKAESVKARKIPVIAES
jgi:HSP20 family molecular chaperone IbpA